MSVPHLISTLCDLCFIGVLTLNELRKCLANTGITDEQIDQLYADLDTDHDGKVLLVK